MEEEAFGHDLNDLASLGAGQGGFEHRLVELRIEWVARRGRDRFDAVFGHDSGQLAQGQLDPFGQGGGLDFQVLGDGIERTAEVVVNRQKIAGEAGGAVLFGLAAVTLATLAGVFGVGQGAPEAVHEVIALKAEGAELFAFDERFQIGEFEVFAGVRGWHSFGFLVLGRHIRPA